MKKYFALIVFLCTLLVAKAALADDWPQFGGPDRDGKSHETGLMKKWPKAGPKLLWVAEDLGTGFGSAAIADGRVYVTGMAKQDKQGILFAFDTDGNRKWQASYGPEWSGSHAGSRTTPTVDGDRVYVLSGQGNLACFDANTGNRIWQADTAKEFAAQKTSWGLSESVLVAEDKVICTPGGTDAAVVALDKMTGLTIWTTRGLSDSSAHCSPILIERAGRKIIVTNTAAHVVGVDLKTGQVLWQYQNKLHKGKPRHVNPNSPLYHDGAILVTSRFVGCMMLRLSADCRHVSEAWTNEELDPHHGGLVLVDGYIYGASTKTQNWMCLDWNTGKTMYEQKWLGKGAVIYADGMLYCYEEKEGTLGLVPASPGSFNVVSSFEISHGTGEHWAHPAISNGTLYVRHGDALMAYDIKQK